MGKLMISGKKGYNRPRKPPTGQFGRHYKTVNPCGKKKPVMNRGGQTGVVGGGDAGGAGDVEEQSPPLRRSARSQQPAASAVQAPRTAGTGGQASVVGGGDAGGEEAGGGDAGGAGEVEEQPSPLRRSARSQQPAASAVQAPRTAARAAPKGKAAAPKAAAVAAKALAQEQAHIYQQMLQTQAENQRQAAVAAGLAQGSSSSSSQGQASSSQIQSSASSAPRPKMAKGPAVKPANRLDKQASARLPTSTRAEGSPARTRWTATGTRGEGGTPQKAQANKDGAQARCVLLSCDHLIAADSWAWQCPRICGFVVCGRCSNGREDIFPRDNDSRRYSHAVAVHHQTCTWQEESPFRK